MVGRQANMVYLRIVADDTLRDDGTANFRVALWGSGVNTELGGESSALAKTGNNMFPGALIFGALLTFGLILMIFSQLFRRISTRRGAAKAHTSGDPL